MLQSVALAALAFLPHPPVAGVYVWVSGRHSARVRQSRGVPSSRKWCDRDIPNAVVLNSLIVNTRHLRPTRAGSADRDARLWMVLHHRRTLLSGGHSLPVPDAPSELRRRPRKRAPKARYARGSPTSARSRFSGFDGHARGHRHFAYNFTVTLPLSSPERSVATRRRYGPLRHYSFGSVIAALIVPIGDSFPYARLSSGHACSASACWSSGCCPCDQRLSVMFLLGAPASSI